MLWSQPDSYLQTEGDLFKSDGWESHLSKLKGENEDFFPVKHQR